MRALSDNASLWLQDAIDYLRPTAIIRRSNEAILAEDRESLHRLPVDAQRALLDAERQHGERLEQIRQLAKLREAELQYRIKRTEILLGDD